MTNDLNQVSSVSLFMTSLIALANEGLFELTHRPSLTRAILLSFVETTEGPGCGMWTGGKLKFDRIQTQFWPFHQQQPGSLVVSANDKETALVNEGHRVSSKSPLLARAVEEVTSKKRTRLDSSHSLKVGN